MQREQYRRRILRDFCIAAIMLALSLGVGILFDSLGFKDVSIYTEFVLCILMVAIFTGNRLCSAATAVLGIMIFNFMFAEPRLSIRAANYGYPLDLITILTVSLLVSTLSHNSEQLSFRTRTLLKTDQLFLQASGEEQIISITAQQLQQLLNRPLAFCMAQNGTPGELILYGSASLAAQPADRDAALHAFATGQDSGRHTPHHAQAAYTYMAIRTADRTLGAAGVLCEKRPLSELERELMRSLLSECALTLERDFYDRKRQETAVQMRHEKLRADLLRSISHDLRTPLTSISGNASLLAEQSANLSEAQKLRLAQTVVRDAQWLLGTVENLLSVTRMEDGRMAIKLQPEMISDVINEAVSYIQRHVHTHSIRCEQEDDMLMAHMDARLILQVLINLIDNAAKYTPQGSEILIRAQSSGGRIALSVIDNGPGIPDKQKAEIFEMFYTTSAGSIDGHRGLGLGLALCKAIIHAHGGEITVSDNTPHGAVFTFTLTEERIVLP